MSRIWAFGNDVDTDQIVPGRYAPYMTGESPAKYAFIENRPEFAAAVRPGDVLAAGDNFGCGSSREYAMEALVGCGLAAIVARSFARIFYRNAVNLGLPVYEAAFAGGEERGLRSGEERGLRSDVERGARSDEVRGARSDEVRGARSVLADGAEVVFHAAEEWLFVAGQPYQLTPLPPFQRAIIAAGGLVPYIRTHGSFPGSKPLAGLRGAP